MFTKLIFVMATGAILSCNNNDKSETSKEALPATTNSSDSNELNGGSSQSNTGSNANNGGTNMNSGNNMGGDSSAASKKK